MRLVWSQKAITNYVLVYLLLFVSGSQISLEASNKVLVIVFGVSVMAWFLLTDRRIGERFVLYFIVFVGFLFSLSLYTNGSLSVPSAISTSMRLLVAYFIVRTVSTDFVDTYIKLVVFLAAVSLFGFAADNLTIFDALITKLPQFGDRGYDGLLYTFKDRLWSDRNKSIFFEPGAYQGVLNAALYLLFFVKTTYEKRVIWIYIAILVAALVTAGSTTGFVIFALGFFAFILRGKVITKAGKTAIIGALVVTIALFATEFESIVIGKLGDYMNPDVGMRGYSAQGRSFDAQTDLKIFAQHVFGIGYEQYKEEFLAIYKSIGAESDQKSWGLSSNGVTRALAIYGLPFCVFYFGSFFWAMNRLLNDLFLASVGFVMLILFLWGESYYFASSVCFSILTGAFVFNTNSLQKAEAQKSV